MAQTYSTLFNVARVWTREKWTLRARVNGVWGELKINTFSLLARLFRSTVAFFFGWFSFWVVDSLYSFCITFRVIYCIFECVYVSVTLCWSVDWAPAGNMPSVKRPYTHSLCTLLLMLLNWNWSVNYSVGFWFLTHTRSSPARHKCARERFCEDNERKKNTHGNDSV